MLLGLENQAKLACTPFPTLGFPSCICILIVLLFPRPRPFSPPEFHSLPNFCSWWLTVLPYHTVHALSSHILLIPCCCRSQTRRDTLQLLRLANSDLWKTSCSPALASAATQGVSSGIVGSKGWVGQRRSVPQVRSESEDSFRTLHHLHEHSP